MILFFFYNLSLTYTVLSLLLMIKVCSWYMSDFGCMKGTTSTDCVRALAHYVKGESRNSLTKLLTDVNSTPTIKFKNFSYRCRSFIEYKYDDQLAY